MADPIWVTEFRRKFGIDHVKLILNKERSQDMDIEGHPDRTRQEYEDWLRKHFPKTEDSRLVEKHWGAQFYRFKDRLLWKGREKEILAYAKEQEKKEQEDKKRR